MEISKQANFQLAFQSVTIESEGSTTYADFFYDKERNENTSLSKMVEFSATLLHVLARYVSDGNDSHFNDLIEFADWFSYCEAFDELMRIFTKEFYEGKFNKALSDRLENLRNAFPYVYRYIFVPDELEFTEGVLLYEDGVVSFTDEYSFDKLHLHYPNFLVVVLGLFSEFTKYLKNMCELEKQGLKVKLNFDILSSDMFLTLDNWDFSSLNPHLVNLKLDVDSPKGLFQYNRSMTLFEVSDIKFSCAWWVSGLFKGLVVDSPYIYERLPKLIQTDYIENFEKYENAGFLFEQEMVDRVSPFKFENMMNDTFEYLVELEDSNGDNVKLGASLTGFGIDLSDMSFKNALKVRADYLKNNSNGYLNGLRRDLERDLGGLGRVYIKTLDFEVSLDGNNLSIKVVLTDINQNK